MRTDTRTLTPFQRVAKEEVRKNLWLICEALKEKGYNPITQIVGYILSGDPTYITSHKNARSIIGRMERDELLEEMVRVYLSEVL
ncbi:MAG: IreB family regulatory phosphoprotein [Defluviitaleaceae bacterium]|nr:IreB family regulatory phosphoprotein [Defluviitaleaceae bacterium]